MMGVKGGIEEPPHVGKKQRCYHEVGCAQRTRRRDSSCYRSYKPQEVAKAGFEVVIESGAGVVANYHDAEYEALEQP